MIISLSGLTGSGKTLTMVMLADLEQQTKKVFTNIKGLKIKHSRLKRKHLFKKVIDDKRTNSKTEYYKITTNWEYWEKNRGCTIMLDEAHEIVYSRSFSSQENKAASKWIAQIRKLTEESGDFRLLNKARRMNNNAFRKVIYNILTRHNNLYITSQTTSKLDKDFRDLSNVHVHCDCTHYKTGLMIVYNYFYFSDEHHSAIENFMQGLQKPKVAWFAANAYFSLYDRFAIAGGETDYL